MRRTTTDICADCSAPGPGWASVNRGVMVCDECCSIHRSLGRHISHIRHLQRGRWAPSTLEMFKTLVSKGANSIWEHQLLDPAKVKNNTSRKPSAKDKLHSTKEDFIRLKYKKLAFMNRLPVKEEDEQSIEDLSKQLHASVRTNNLETSLRLMALGAKVDYFHRERGNMALHVAASAGQALQCELLVEHGADPCALDSRGHTAVECARIAGYHEMADRLIDCQYELTDRLTYYVCGSQPVHVQGQHHMLPNLRSNVDTSENAILARSKLHALSNVGFEELAADVYDEVDRRETEADWLQTQNHTSIVSGKNHVPFLPVNPSLSTVRNQGRQKLATFSAKEFSDLIVDILMDTKRRQMESVQSDQVDGRLVPIDGMEVINQQQYDQLLRAQARPSEVAYDDPADQRGLRAGKRPPRVQHDYDEVTIEGGVTHIGGVSQLKGTPMSNHSGHDETDHRESPELEVKRETSMSGDSDRTLMQADQNHASIPDEAKQEKMDVLAQLRSDLVGAEARIQQLLQVNSGMGEEIRLLQAMVQKLMQENSMLRTLQVNSPNNRSPVMSTNYSRTSTPMSASQRSATPPPIPEKTVKARKNISPLNRAAPAQRSVSTSAVPSELQTNLPYSNSPPLQPKTQAKKTASASGSPSPKSRVSIAASGQTSPLLKSCTTNHVGTDDSGRQAVEMQNDSSSSGKEQVARPANPPKIPPKTRLRPRPQTSFEGSASQLPAKTGDSFASSNANISANGSSQTGVALRGVAGGGKRALVPTAKQLREAGRARSAAPSVEPDNSNSSLSGQLSLSTQRWPKVSDEPPAMSNPIVQQTEQITKHIQGMLINARNGDLPKFVPGARKIVMAVNDMASLFPQRPDSEAVRTSLRMLVESAARLQDECSGAHRLSFVLRRDDEGRLSAEDDAKVSHLVQQVITCASDIAKSARELVHYVTEVAN